MNEASKKTERFFSLIERHKFISSLIFCALFFLIHLILNGFIISSPNDDFCVFKVIYNGNTAVTCLGFFYTSLCVFLQPIFGVINVYMTLQELICLISFAAINYVFTAKLGAKRGLFYSAVLNILFMSCGLMMILFSFSAIIASVAGLVCVLYGSCYEKRNLFKTIQIVTGIILLFFGSEFRTQPYMVCCAFAVVFFGGFVVSQIIKTIKTAGLKSSFKDTIRKYLFTGIMLAAALISTFALNTASEALKYTDKNYAELADYNNAYAAVSDTATPYWYYNPEGFNNAGIKSKSELQVFKTWFVDDDFLTLDKLRQITESYKEDNLVKNGILDYIISPYAALSSKMFESGLFILYFLVLIVAVFAAFIVSVMKPSLRGYILRIGLTAFLWSFCFMISDVFAEECIMLLPLIILSLMISWRYNSIQAIITIPLIAFFLVLYSYLVGYRLLLHTVFSVVFPTFVFLVYSMSGDNRIKFNKGIKLGKVFVLTLSLALAALSVAGCINYIPNKDAKKALEDNRILEQYIDDNPDKVFLINQMTLEQPYYNPFILPKEHLNTADYGLWLKKAEYYKNTYKRNGINHLFKDAIDSNKYIVVYEETISNDKSKNINIANLEEYYNNHYATNGRKIVIQNEKRVGNYSLFRVVTK